VQPHLRDSFARLLYAALAAVQLKSFVHRDGGQLKLEGQPFYFLGFNAYWLADYGYEVSGGLQWLRTG
jgi:hypothetical protein